MLAADPTESTDAMEPADPIERIDPAEPMDRIDPAEPMDRIDPLDPMLKMEPSVFRMRSFSQCASRGTKVPAAYDDHPYRRRGRPRHREPTGMTPGVDHEGVFSCEQQSCLPSASR